MIVPLFSILLYHFAIGGNPIGLKIGVVNEEMKDFDQCENSSLVTTSRDGFDCNLNMISCRFLNRISEDIASKVYYKTLDEAFEDARMRSIHAVIHFSSNFSQSVQFALENRFTVSDKALGNRMIDVYVDNYYPHISYFFKWRLQSTYEYYTKKLMRDCKYPEKLEITPIDFKAPIYGNPEKGEKMTMGASLMMLILFFTSASMSVTTLTNERIGGVWNRTFLAGAKMKEVIFSYIIVHSFLVLLLVIESFFLFYYVFEFHDNGEIKKSIIVAMICGQIGIVGLIFGMCLSCIFKNPMISCCSLVASSIPAIFLSGKFKGCNFLD